MKKTIITLCAAMLLSMPFRTNASTANLYAVESQIQEEPDTSWTIGAGIGLDFTQLMQINPKVGSGENRIGLGSITTLFANYQKDKILWNNSGSLLFAIQRLGSGISSLDPDKNQPFQKTIDELRLASNIGFQTADESKWYYSLDFTFLSQLTPTYEGSLVSKPTDDALSIAKLLSPAQLTLSPGMIYVPTPNFTLMLSPASIKMILVMDDDIAALGIHGNPWNSTDDFENVEFQLGATAAAAYVNKYLEDKLTVSSTLRLFSNYLEDPQNIDLDFRNEFAYQIWKGLTLSLNLNFFYDHDIPVQVTDSDFPGGIMTDIDGNPVLARRLSVTESLFLKYNYIF